MGYIDQMNKGFVYILQSQKSGRYYVGSSIDVFRRIGQHNSNKVASTSKKGPWKVVLVQGYDSLKDARKIEYRIKKLKRRDYIDKMVREGCIKLSIGD